MLAFSAVPQFPTNGLSTREAGERVQATIRADHITTVNPRDWICIAGAGNHLHLLDWLAVLGSSPPAPTARLSADTAEMPLCLSNPGITWPLPSRGGLSPARASAVMVKPICHRVELHT